MDHLSNEVAALLQDSRERIVVERKDEKQLVKAGRLVRLVDYLTSVDAVGKIIRIFITISVDL